MARIEMLTHNAPARPVAGPRPFWSPAPVREVPIRASDEIPVLPPPRATLDGQVETFLASLRVLTGADELVISVQGADEEEFTAFAIGRTGLSRSACRRVAECGSIELPLGGDAIWMDCLADGRAWQILRLPVPSRRGRSNAVVSLVFQEAPSARRRAVAEQLCALRPMIDAYLKLWQRSRADARRTEALHSALNSIDIGIIAIDRNAR
ncbi:MAG TPA: hypothetical protein VFR28_00320, partial [Allosphingosinicella sp.]|nr:hypothetical protein [Allosphingosinicella sp.]